MQVDFVPLKDFSSRYSQGWRLAKQLDATDYAALMTAPTAVADKANKYKAAVSRNEVRYGRSIEASETRDRIETLEEENRQLRDQIARLTGKNEAFAARRAFGLTEAESFIFMMLVRCGKAEYAQLQGSIYTDGRLDRIADPEWAIRSHMKRIRRKTRQFEIDFETVYGFGYQMSEAARKKARTIINGISERVPCES